MGNDIACIDLFCGAGGLTNGLNAENLNVVAGIDVDPACGHPFEFNNSGQFIERDIEVVSASELSSLFDEAPIRVLAGCAPCQPFSTYSQRYETVGTSRWGLMYRFGHFVRELRPEIVTMENVSTVGKHKVFDDFVAMLRKSGYHVTHDIVDCAEYGLPQHRRRKVLLASLLGPIALAPPTNTKPGTVRGALSELCPLSAGEEDPNDPLHVAARLSALNLERIRASKPGGTWRDWPEHLIADCHKRKTGKTYPSVYGRMTWDDPSPALTTQFFGFGNGRYGHPEQDRAISLREGAILQGFPRSYSFVPDDAPIEFKPLGRLIGNAVPVTLGRAIGCSINEHLDATRNEDGGRANHKPETLVA